MAAPTNQVHHDKRCFLHLFLSFFLLFSCLAQSEKWGMVLCTWCMCVCLIRRPDGYFVWRLQRQSRFHSDVYLANFLFLFLCFLGSMFWSVGAVVPIHFRSGPDRARKKGTTGMR
ncbi:hypothetical protein BKA81DRAFT_228727 [Phyllosticta paracitricarpa]